MSKHLLNRLAAPGRKNRDTYAQNHVQGQTDNKWTREQTKVGDVIHEVGPT